MIAYPCILPLLIGWILDLLLGDPRWMPHPVVWFGKMISLGEKRLNKGIYRKLKGALLTLFLISFVFAVTWALLHFTSCMATGNLNFSLFTFHYPPSSPFSSSSTAWLVPP